MKVFVTGATGFVGTAITEELLAHGHQVLGLARSSQSAEKLTQLGAQVLPGDLEAPDSLRRGAEICDAIIHAGFGHDFSRFAEACATDRAAIGTLGEAIANTQKPLIVTAGVAFLDAAGPVTTETDRALPPSATYPRASETAVTALRDRGIPASLMRLPPSVHGKGDHGFVPMLIHIAWRKGRSVSVGEGNNVWPAVHVHDAASAFRLALENGRRGETYHAVAEEGVPFRTIAEAIASGVGVPHVSLSEEAAREHFEWFYGFASIDQPTASHLTRDRLGWNPTGADLLTDIRNAGYFPVATR